MLVYNVIPLRGGTYWYLRTCEGLVVQAMKPPVPTPIYHFTHVDNLTGILGAEGVLCNNNCEFDRVSVAYGHLQRRRNRIEVPRRPYGNLHDYVPFYFCYRPPMLYAIHSGEVTSYKGGQDALVYLVSNVQDVKEAGLDFVFTDRSALYDYAGFYTSTANLKKVDWSIMPGKWWNNTVDYPDRKECKQAEFLVHKFFSWELVAFLAVKTPQMQRRVESLLDGHPSSTRRPVWIKPSWYYL